jgi:hypothetical protein
VNSAYGLGALTSPGIRTLILASLPVGFALGTLEVALPAFSESEGAKELAGVLLAVWSAASGVGGLLWGARGGEIPVLDAHQWFGWLLPLGVAPMLLAGSPLTMALLVILAGLPVAPLIASRNQLVGSVSVPGTETEAYTWPLTALVAGVSLGAAVGGAVVEAGSWSNGVVVATSLAVVGAGIIGLRRGTLGRPAAAAAG